MQINRAWKDSCRLFKKSKESKDISSTSLGPKSMSSIVSGRLIFKVVLHLEFFWKVLRRGPSGRPLIQVAGPRHCRIFPRVYLDWTFVLFFRAAPVFVSLGENTNIMCCDRRSLISSEIRPDAWNTIRRLASSL